ncbi:MAG: DUF2996 domain-containing protein [Cyanobacteria bacterium J083]|nr:MAG: DUF2996 domain-containing protein [Cyanobacteria bacterium J083]
MAEETKTAGKAKKPVAKKAKPPAIEDKPFPEFIQEHFIPALAEAMQEKGIEDLQLTFVKAPIDIADLKEECWQVIGKWEGGKKQFNIYFLEEDIKGQKAFSYATNGSKPSTIESFMIDERKITLDLMVMYTLQRLNSQKWLGNN